MPHPLGESRRAGAARRFDCPEEARKPVDSVDIKKPMPTLSTGSTATTRDLGNGTEGVGLDDVRANLHPKCRKVVSESCGKEKWRILPVGCLTTNRPPGKAAAGGMRHGEAYQEVGAAA